VGAGRRITSVPVLALIVLPMTAFAQSSDAGPGGPPASKWGVPGLV
jgi:hypothetical protein